MPLTDLVKSPPAQIISAGTALLHPRWSSGMHVFFDIQHRGDLYLDDEGEHFKSLDAA
jgi:hypothetical protein